MPISPNLESLINVSRFLYWPNWNLIKMWNTMLIRKKVNVRIIVVSMVLVKKILPYS